MEGGASRESDFEGQHAMSQEFHRSERNRNSTLGGHQESSVHQNLGERSDRIRGWAKISNLLILEGLEQRQRAARNKKQVERLTAQFSSVMSDSL